MAQYIGFSTVNACNPKTTNMSYGSAGGPGQTTDGIVWGKKYKLVDTQLVIQDFINALNIRYGAKVGQPWYGSRIWDWIFDPNVDELQSRVENEIRRLASNDPRLDLNYVKAYPYRNGILMEVEVAVVPFNIPQTINVSFNPDTNTAIQV